MLNAFFVLRKRQDALRVREHPGDGRKADRNERRFSGVLPFEENLFGRKVILTRHISWRSLLCTIQAERLNCSIHIASASMKARATLVILSGRGLVCTFRKRGQKRAVTGEDAFKEMLVTIKENDCTFNLALISPAIALGMAAIAHGRIDTSPAAIDCGDFRQSVESLISEGATGCVQVLNGYDEILVTSFVHEGEIQCFSAGSSSKPNRDDKALKKIIKNAGSSRCRIWRLGDIEELERLMFDLTELKLSGSSQESNTARYSSSEQFLRQFYKRPNLRETFMHHNISAKEAHENDINDMAEIAVRRSVTTFSHMINPLE